MADTVCFENGGLKDENGLSRTDTQHTSATQFKGTVAGEGTITVYGKSDLWYLVASGGAIPTSFNQPKLLNVVQASITGAKVESVELPEMPSLKQFSLNNSTAKSVDVAKATALTSLTINSMTVAPQLTGIDVSKNTELTYLSLQGSQNTPGLLTSLDLTQNTKLEGVYVQYNQLKEIKLAERYEALGTFNASYNQLTTVDAAAMPAVKWFDVRSNQIAGDMDITSEKLTNVYVNNNQLTSVKVPNVTKQFYFDNNNMNFRTMPAKPAGMNTTSKTKQYHYAPQAALQVPAEVTELDLSDQLTAQGILEAPATTTFTFVTASGTTLVEDTDYKVTAPGKFQFLKEQGEKVHGVLASEAFPLFTGDNAFVTTEFTAK